MRIIYCLLSVFLLTSCGAWAQKANYTTTKTASKRTKESYKKAYAYIKARDYDAAIKALEKIAKKDPTFVNTYVELGNVYEAAGDLEQAISSFERLVEIAPDYNPKVYLALGRLELKQENYPAVEKHMEKFLSYDKLHPNLVRIAKKRKAIAQFRPKALANPVPFEPKNLGPTVNSAAREYFPSLTLEGELVYTRQIGEGRKGQEDLYSSSQTDQGWAEGRPLPNVNTSENEGAQSISADGRLLVFTVCNRPEDYGSCDLYYSRKVNGRWSEPKNMGAPINTGNWESQPSIAPNSDGLYFIRGGARGQGNKDLYYSDLQEDGTWSEPQPIKELNTVDDESAPHLHPDGQTLYFSSNGHAGMGGLDLFVSKKQADGTWGKPENLGYPINTKEQEEALAVDRMGTLAYLASNRVGGLGSLDLYSFELPTAARPAAVTYVKGRTIDAKTGKAISAGIELVDLKTQQVVAKCRTGKDGSFFLCLPTGNYALSASREGYLFFSAHYELTEIASLKAPFQLEAALQPIEIATAEKLVNVAPIVLENVFFATASAKLEAASKAELNRLKNLLDNYPKMRIQLRGHTDNVGEAADNLSLSEARAQAVKSYLIEQGIAAERLEAKGYGETQPRGTNETPEGRAGNRRTEFLVL